MAGMAGALRSGMLMWSKGPIQAAQRLQHRSFAVKSIAVYPGDGIGQEVTPIAIDLLKEVSHRLASGPHAFRLKCDWYDWGCDYYEQNGTMVPPDFLNILRPYDAIYLGAVGWPATAPDSETLKPLIEMRQGFDQYACVRPARTFPGVPTPLASGRPVDMLVIRENSEGEYVDCGGRFKRGTPEEVAVQSAVHTRLGVERILKFAFEEARKRPRKRLTMATKSNAQRHGMVMWDDILDELQPSYKDIDVRREHIDALAMKFVLQPEEFDVIVASNLFGDILTDLSGAIVGGLGLNASANLNPDRRFPSLFEPVHGSAPDIAGKGVANPVAAILSACMMIDWIGVHPTVGEALRSAVSQCLAAGEATHDLGGKLGTLDFAAAVLRRLEI